MKAEGRLRHHFHARYFATIALVFSDAESARAGARVLGKAWEPIGNHPYALSWTGETEDLEAVKEKLAGLGLKIQPCGFRHCADECSGQEIDSVRHSVDFGPAFTVELPEPARLDGEPKTRLLAHVPAGKKFFGGADTLEEVTTGQRTKLHGG